MLAFTGSATVPSGPGSHGNVAANADGCATCHMAAAWGAVAGGHTWFMQYLYHGSVEDNVAGCNVTGCHSTVTDFEVAGVYPDRDDDRQSPGAPGGHRDQQRE